MPDFKMPPRDGKSALSSMRGNHVAYRVADYEVAQRWFIEKLDFRVVVEWPFAGMRLGYLAPPNDDNAIIEIIGDGDQAHKNNPTVLDLGESLGHAGTHHYCFAVASVDETVAELKSRGVNMVGEGFVLDDISRKLAFFSDPFGNLFELAEVVG